MLPPPLPLHVGHDAWVVVSVATLWRLPSSPRPVDAAALRTPASIRTWLGAMTDADRRGLSGRADTQALLGDRVVVTALSGRWAKVVVPNQPTPLDRRGYPGWVPTGQLTATRPAATAQAATIITPTAWLRTDDTGARPALEASFGTRLGLVSLAGGWARVVVPPSRTLRLPAADVSVTSSIGAALPRDGASLTRSALLFRGLPYLWAGTSGFGLDCSGLTSLVHRVHGITIPRDAAPQSRAGRAVTSGELRPGDLLFYATHGVVHHVALYVGGGRMVHAPRTGSPVAVIRIDTSGYPAELSGVRRYTA